MNKEEALNDFLKGLRIVLNNALAYSKDHPYLIKSVENFKQKIDLLFNFLNPIRIDIAVDSLFIDGKKLEKTTLYTEIASMFHQRKLKSVEFRQGLTIEELADFLYGVSLPIKEILKKGGARNIISKNNPHIILTELDYSRLLGAAGEEVKDVWLYLFKEVVQRQDQKSMNEFADDFENVMKKLKIEELIKDEQIKKSLLDFVTYLKNNQKEKFYKCAHEIFKSAARYKDILKEENIDTLKSLFKDFNEPDFASLLWDGILKDDAFDILSLELFSRITGEQKAKEISSSFLSKTANKESLENSPKAIKKTQDLLSVSSSQSVSEVYRNTLSNLLGGISFDKSLSFDRNLLRINYLFILLNLLTGERNKERLKVISERLSKELESVIGEGNFGYLKNLSDILKERKKEDSSLIEASGELERHISKSVEDNIWQEEPSSDLEYLVDTLGSSSLNADFYLDKIFNENKFNPDVLKLFFRFFPSASPLFYKNLEKKYADLGFLGKMIESLAVLEPYLFREILKHIFSFSNEIIKIEVLKAMQKLSDFDQDFLLVVLQKGTLSLKKEALVILARDQNARKIALENLLAISSPWGKKNKVILENIILVEDLELKEAEGYLITLSKKPFFWNRGVRRKALEVLKNKHVRKD